MQATEITYKPVSPDEYIISSCGKVLGRAYRTKRAPWSSPRLSDRVPVFSFEASKWVHETWGIVKFQVRTMRDLKGTLAERITTASARVN